MKTFYALASLFATRAVADMLPACANSCIVEGMQRVPCKMDEIKCLCKKDNFAILQADGMPCLQKSCGEKKAESKRVQARA